MKLSKCLMGILLSSVLLIGSVFAAEALTRDVKEKGYNPIVQDRDHCLAGEVDDCADDDCCPESWIGDGFEDCEDQAFGCDLTCYDNDGGDCPEDCPSYTCWDGSCVDSASDCPDEPDVPEPTGVCIAGDNYSGQAAVTMSWDISTECGDGICNGDEDYYNCPDDCNEPGTCNDGEVVD